MKCIGKILAVIVGVLFGAFAATQVIYWLNLDSKLIYCVVRPVVSKVYDIIPRDRKF